MKLFSELIQVLGTTTKTNQKLLAIQEYFEQAISKDKIWVIALFSGRRPKRAVSSTLLRQWCMEIIGISPWLFEESYHTVGDLAETITLLLPEIDETNREEKPLHHYLEFLLELGKKDESIKKEFVTDSWQKMNTNEKFVFNKLITGGFRIGVSQKLIVNAIAKTTGISPSIIAHRISGNWDPAVLSFEELLSTEHSESDFSKPYPFYLAYAVENNARELGEPALWQAEWKWDGIRGQIIRRNDNLFVWIGRKNITKKELTAAPVGFIAYDLLEFEGKDIRNLPLTVRRTLLEELISSLQLPFLHLSAIISFDSWDELTETRLRSRDMGSEGLMLKRKDSTYQVGRKKGDWWKWKIDPLTIDAVMIYAQKGSGRRSNLYTDYTFAVRDGDQLVSFAKAYSGLTDKEFAQVDHFIKRNSIEKFGPVRTVKPELVFEIAFEGIAASKRHKSGVALRFPRMNRWRKDKTAAEINTLEDLKAILENYNKRESLSA